MNLLMAKSMAGVYQWNEDGLFDGEIVGVLPKIRIVGSNHYEILNDFREKVDVYLKDCEHKYIEPYSFNVPELIDVLEKYEQL